MGNACQRRMQPGVIRCDAHRKNTGAQVGLERRRRQTQRGLLHHHPHQREQQQPTASSTYRSTTTLKTSQHLGQADSPQGLPARGKMVLDH